MNRYVCAWLIVLFLPITALAQCPTQETVVLYLNGVDTTEKSAQASRDLIKDEVLKVSEVLKNCLTFDYVYNTNEPLFLDFLEAGIQKAEEQEWSTTDFWRWFFRIPPITSGFADLLVDFYSNVNASVDLGRFVLGDQVEEHLAKIQEHLKQNRRVILVCHSQGCLYANEEWDRLTEEEKSQVDVIAVATPTDHVADNGPYITLEEDGIASLLFPLALPANASNDEECPDYWTCHSFKEFYMRGKNSLTRGVNEIVALLPVAEENCRIEGIVKDWDYETIVSGARVALWKEFAPHDIAVEVISNSTGNYCIPENVADGRYWLETHSPNGEWLGGRGVWLWSGQTSPLVIDFPIAVLM